MGILLTISDLLIPVTVLCIVVFGCLQRMDIYEVFLEGAKEGLQTVLDILPTLIGLMMAVEVMRAGGLLDILVRLIRPAADAVGFPAELAPLSLVRLVSSSAATGLLTDLFAKYGPDSFLGRTASVMIHYDELYGNGVLYDEPVFSFCRDSENAIYAALRPSGKPCRHLCGCGTGAACFLRLDRV